VPDRNRIPTFPKRLPQTERALEYAERMHARQQRADGTPFILHPREVATLLYHAGAPDHLIAAGAMHDLVEKTDATASDLRQRFGQRITELVLAVSDDDRITGYAKRKAALRRQLAGAGEEALTLFAADKLSKLRELRRETGIDPTATGRPNRARELRARRLRHYQRSLALLEERLAESPLVRALREELASLQRERAIFALAP
jgi:(p)ppGpp synthase/HD superfamily hydrolase